MTLSYTVYDWPNTILPARQLFFAGGQAFEGGFTSGGARILAPEPGGRSFLDVEFDYQLAALRDPMVSWACSKIANGNIFRVPIARSPQIISAADLGLSVGTLETTGLPWAAEGLNSEGPWDNDQNWSFEVGALVDATALEGATSVSIDIGSLTAALKPGHVIGIGDVPYLVADIEWDGTAATVTIDPPLRADVAADDYVTFRPKMLCVAESPDSFRGLYEPADLIRLGSVRFIEAIL